MIRVISSQVLVLLVAVMLVVPPSLYLMPQKAEAQWAVAEVAGNLFTNIITTIEQTLNTVTDILIEVESYANWINTYVLQPIAFIQSIKSMKSITSGVISFVTGQSNGNGSAQFVQNLQGNLQKVGDTQMLSFLAQFRRNSNSPFASSIASSLSANYLQNTSLAGFWAANKNTLPQFSANPNAFLAGNWSQGGVAAWFALTTQDQNNPYTLYANAQSKLGSVVAGAQSARSQVLAFGQGFMSWCGTSDSATQMANASDAAATNLAALAPKSVDCTPSTQNFVDAMGSCYASAAEATQADATNNAAEQAGNAAVGRTATGGIGVNPGDACTNKDGTPGTIQTPGSTIKATLDKVLGGSQDKLNTIGNIGTQAGNIVSLIGSIMNTVNFAQQVLGGGSNGGLASLGATTGSQNTTGDTAITTATQQVIQTAITSPASGASTMTSRISEYKSLWATITSAANATKGSLNDLIAVCNANGNTAIAAQGQAAIASQVDPVLASANAANSDIAAAQALLDRSATGETTPADIQTLGAMHPTSQDVVRLQEEAKRYTTGKVPSASPDGSLNVSGGTTIDRLALLALNAAQLKASCVPDTGSGSTGNGQ